MKVKAIAIILVLVCLVAFVGLGYLYMTSSVTVVDVNMTICEAKSQTALFNELITQVASGSAAATVYSDAIPQTPEQCVFLQYSVKLKNSTFLNAELAEIRITPIPGDYLQVGEAVPTDLSPGTTGTVNAVLLTDKDAKTTHELTISYYLWGIPFFVRTTYSD